MKQVVNIELEALMKEQTNEVAREAFQKEKRRLQDFIRSRVPAREDAEDILQDVFYQFLQNFSPLQPIEQISSWLFRVARNRIIDGYRKKKTESLEEQFTYTSEDGEEGHLELPSFVYDTSDHPDKVYARSLVWEALSQALEELPKEQREVFVWHELEGKDFKEIAELTGENANTLMSRKRYAINHLRKRLQHLYEELINS